MSLSDQLVAALTGKTKGAAPAKKAAPKKATPVGVNVTDGPPVGANPMIAPYKPPTMVQRMKDTAQHAKVNATRDWVEGRISTKRHEQAHARANHVIKNAGRLVRPEKKERK